MAAKKKTEIVENEEVVETTAAPEETAEETAPAKKGKKPTKKPVKKPAKKPAKEPAKRTEGKPEEEKKRSGFIKFISGLFFKKMAEGGAAELREHSDEVDQLNVFPVPDGDTGTNMSMTIDSGVAALEGVESESIGEISETLSRGMLLGARGNSGVILSQFFAGISKGIGSVDKADPATLGHALELAVESAYSSVMTPTEGTILTVAREAVEYAVSRVNSKSTINSLFNDLATEMHASLRRTPELLPALKEAGVVDSGAAGLLYIIEGFNRVLGGEVVDSPLPKRTAPAAAISSGAFSEDSDMVYAYCTEMLVQLTKKKGDPDKFDLDALKSFLSELGDSIVALKDGSIVKLHVHTFTPDLVLGYMLKHGEFITVKIENMSLQHTELAQNGEAPDAKPDAPKEKPAPKKNAIVAVCMGEGLEAIYRDLGCDYIVRGGQTQNPSTNDFIAAFDSLNAENIFVLPNNGNILMAAEQAADLYKEANVIVLPSKSVAVGYAMLSATDITAEPEEVKAQMEEALARVKAGYVSPAIRNTQIEGVNINDGDTLGIIGKEIVVSSPKQLTAAVALADALLSNEGVFMLTAFYGKDAPEDEVALVEEKIKTMHPSAEIYFANGAQEIYPYIFVVE